MVEDILGAWSPWAVLAALVGGIGYGVVMRYLRPHVEPVAILFSGVVLFSMWYVPQIARIVVAPETTPSNPYRFLGFLLHAGVVFMGAAYVTLRWGRRG